MRDLAIRSGRVAVLLGAALALAACSRDEAATNAADLNNLDANAMLETPANDATAMESAVNAVEPIATANGSEESNTSSDVLGETEGGDTGGNTTDSNRTGP